MKRLFAVLIVGSMIFSSSALAYYDNYPPYKLGQAPFKSLSVESLPEAMIPKFIKDSDLWPLYGVHKVDIDGNGLDDFIVLMFSGAGTLLGNVNIYLKMEDGSYTKIAYEASGIGPEDFVDINNDGKWEVIVTNVYQGKKHNYLAYDVYEFKGYKLVNADQQFNGFPKFVWMTFKDNDKDTVHLTERQREEHILEKNKAFSYEIVSGH